MPGKLLSVTRPTQSAGCRLRQHGTRSFSVLGCSALRAEQPSTIVEKERSAEGSMGPKRGPLRKLVSVIALSL